MKKILLLGGSSQQVIAIETAKMLGYYTVLCDFLKDNPGQYKADKFYLVSTTDKEAVLKIAQEEQVNGVLAYASDPAAPTAAYIAEKMNLSGNLYESVEILCNKDKFRRFLADNGFNAPMAKGFSSKEDALSEIDHYRFPVIVKPVDSSGSKGATVLHSNKDIESALEFAFSFSRSHRVIIEEFVEKKHPYLIGGDIFVENGKIILWGLLNCHRDSEVNNLVPVGKSYPLELDDKDIDEVKNTLQCMVNKLGIGNGSMNVELVVDKNDRVWPIDIGPRSGGNMIPDLLGYIFNVDIAKMSIQAAMGVKIECNQVLADGCFATHNIHSSRNGIYQSVQFSDNLKKYLVKACLYKKQGDQVEYFDNAAKCLGIIFLKFPDTKIMHEVLSNINNEIDIKLT